MTKHGLSIAERFWRFVDKSDDCWLWMDPRTRNGYGQFTDQRKKHGAHRLAYQLTRGPIPEGLLVMHSCDNRPCVNPSHLSLGTVKDNSLDMVAKGRCRSGGPPGERSGNAVLTEKDVREIRRRRAAGETLRRIADDFGVTPTNVRYVAIRRTWTHVT